MSEAGWSSAGVDGTHRYATAALSVFWPEEEFHILVARINQPADDTSQEAETEVA